MFFGNIIGQPEVKSRMLKSVAENRVSHAQLIFGHEGGGALPLAVAYAQYIHCTKRNEKDACGECPSCQKYSKLVHPDLHFVFPIKNSDKTPVSDFFIYQFRELFLENPYFTYDDWGQKIEAENKQLIIPEKESGDILRKLSLTAFEGEFKIMIIWLAEKMNVTAANKLLKLLEEPPDKTLFLLVTENEDQLLRTIVSRAQLIRVHAITDADLTNALVERHQLSQADAEKISFQSDGNYARARQLLERNEQAEYNLHTFQILMRACLKFDAAKILNLVDDLSAIGRERQKHFLGYALDLVRESLLVNYGDRQLVRMAGEELAFITKFAPFIHAANGERFIEEFNLAISHIERNGAPKIIFLDLAFKINELINVPKPTGLPA